MYIYFEDAHSRSVFKQYYLKLLSMYVSQIIVIKNCSTVFIFFNGYKLYHILSLLCYHLYIQNN